MSAIPGPGGRLRSRPPRGSGPTASRAHDKRARCGGSIRGARKSTFGVGELVLSATSVAVAVTEVDPVGRPAVGTLQIEPVIVARRDCSLMVRRLVKVTLTSAAPDRGSLTVPVIAAAGNGNSVPSEGSSIVIVGGVVSIRTVVEQRLDLATRLTKAEETRRPALFMRTFEYWMFGSGCHPEPDQPFRPLTIRRPRHAVRATPSRHLLRTATAANYPQERKEESP